MNRSVLILAGLAPIALAVAAAGCGGGSSSSAAGATSAPVTSMIRMGAATSPKYGAVFDAMKRDFERQGYEFDYTLYMDYFDLGDAFMRRDVDIAWNTPQGHARAVLRTNDQVGGPIARDVDIQYTCQVVVRKGSGIKTIQDLVGKRFCLGSTESAECYDIPKLHLLRAGVDVETQCQFVTLDGAVDLQMNDTSTAQHVLDAIANGTVDAGAVGEKSTRALRADPSSPLQVIWTSPPFTHCIMTTHADYHPTNRDVFRQVLLSETMTDPIGREVLVNEGNDRTWIDSDNERDLRWGFEALVEAARQSPLAKPAPTGTSFRIGAVCTTPQIASFRALSRYLRREGEDGLVYTLYGTQGQLDAALASGEVDVAWSTPLAHARWLERTQGKAIAVLARDTDLATRFHVVVRKGAGIADLAGLAGKALALGNEDAAELSVLPRHLLPGAGLPASTRLVSLNGARDAEWRWADGAASIAAAVSDSVVDAGVVDQATADAIAADPQSNLVVIHASAPFGGRVLTALDTIPQGTLTRFRQLLAAMTTTDPTASIVLQNERCARFVAGANDGYVELRAAIAAQGLSLGPQPRR